MIGKFILLERYGAQYRPLWKFACLLFRFDFKPQLDGLTNVHKYFFQSAPGSCIPAARDIPRQNIHLCLDELQLEISFSSLTASAITRAREL